LVPAAAFNLAFSTAGRDPSEHTAEILANRFHVSRELVFRMFLDRRLITQTNYEEAAERWAAQRQRQTSGGNPYRTKIAYLGRDYIGMAFKEFYQNRIDEEQLGGYLATKPKHIPVLEEYFVEGGQ